MPIIAFSDVASAGIVADRPAHELPPGAWSGGRNVRFFDGYVEKFYGDESTFATVQVAPYYVQSIGTTQQYYWFYAGLGAIYATDGATHWDVTRAAGGAYGATADARWTGGNFNGVPILNNPADDPQAMATVDPTTQDFAALANWPASTKCRALRPFRNFLVALDVTQGGTRYPQMVKWSHRADPGAVPASWDPTDTSKDAGEFSLSDSDGFVLDCLSMRDVNVVYKEDSVWLMQEVGGDFIFRFAKAFSTIGMLAQHCMASLPSGEHVLLSIDDVVLHNGQQAESIIDKKLRRTLFNSIDTTNFARSFVVTNLAKREVWVCVPEAGANLPSKAYVWSWKDGTWGLRDLPSVAHIAGGVVNPTADLTWDADTGEWDLDSSVWDARTYAPQVLKLLEALPGATQLRVADTTNGWNGAAFTSMVERTGLGVPLHQDKPPDMTSMKFLRGLWPRIEGTDGGVVQVTVGGQDTVDSPVVWRTPQNYIIGSTQKLDCRVSGRLLAVRFQSDTAIEWRLHGYELDVERGGAY